VTSCTRIAGGVPQANVHEAGAFKQYAEKLAAELAAST